MCIDKNRKISISIPLLSKWPSQYAWMLSLATFRKYKIPYFILIKQLIFIFYVFWFVGYAHCKAGGLLWKMLYLPVLCMLFSTLSVSVSFMHFRQRFCNKIYFNLTLPLIHKTPIFNIFIIQICLTHSVCMCLII